MYQKIHFLTIFMVFASFSLCFSSYPGGQFAIDQSYSHHDSKFSSLPNWEMTSNSIISTPSPSPSPTVFNVDDFGAKGNGGDDSEAFNKAWKEACSSENAIMLVPKDRIYHLNPNTFSGPCKSDLTLKIFGTIKASPRILDYRKSMRHWLVFKNVDDFTVQGGGIIDGNGRKWWKSSCKRDKSRPCTDAPTAVTFYECDNLKVANLRFKNAQKMHLSFQKCINVVASSLWITAPRDSPNTDGIHVTETKNIIIKNCVIATGDDCISIVSGSKYVQAVDIKCGPGHGISIGSLGAGNSEAHVSNVIVNNTKFTGTTNGVRIKTWQGGTGYAKNILFQNIAMNNVTNPIIIDQNYCDRAKPCSQQNEAVQVSEVTYKNIRGTSASEIAVKFDCSKSFPCHGILMENVNLSGFGDTKARAYCANARFTRRLNVSPQCPLHSKGLNYLL